MKSSVLFSAVSIFLLLGWTGCELRPADYEKEEFAISGPHVIYFGNYAEVIVDPGNEKCRIVFEHYNRKRGNAFRIPYGVATVHFADRKVIVSDEDVGNGAIKIDGREYSLRSSSPIISANGKLSWTNGSFEQEWSPQGPWVYPLKREDVLQK